MLSIRILSLSVNQDRKKGFFSRCYIQSEVVLYDIGYLAISLVALFLP